MKVTYRGHDIDAHRAKSLGGDVLLYYSIFRVSDGYEVSSGFSYGEDKILDFIGYMKQKVDAMIQHPEEEIDYIDLEDLEHHKKALAGL